MDAERRAELERRVRWEPDAAEPPIFARWEAGGCFAADPSSGREPYVIALPPPNVTGELHMGHALNGAIQDALIRLHRMRGYETLWICGTDHAGIGTENVVERQLRKAGTSRNELGREAFIRRVWEWRAEYGGKIIQQYKTLGCALDYEHERFTMDDGYVRAVLRTFVDLYGKGYIYRDNRIVNWCPGCASAISDLEVRYEHASDTLYDVRYRIEGTNDFLVVATVRPETILADTAVAVHPADDRYRHLVGQTAVVPLVDRPVPIVADEYVRMDFGTGALKITPGHDPNDFDIGRRHGLPELQAIGFDGRMTELAGPYAGLTAAEARERIRNDLFDQELLVKEHPYEHEVGHCDRSGDRIEPLISLQWFMRMDELARPARAVVRSGAVRFHPKTQENTYFHWMEALRPWCISRQLWWGHQLPVWYCPDGHVTVALDDPDTCAECGARELERDPDVLDTWFSSGLWPFATLGWPEETERLRAFYPGTVLSTARDIINLWVARMIMLGIEFLDEPPFRDVLVHSIIQAPDGRRMSKSLGTGIDPLDLVREHGADATRYGLLKMSSTQDVRFARGTIEEGARFANKLWNAARFVLLQTDPAATPAPAATEVVDRWLLSRLESAGREIVRLFDAYDMAGATKAIYAFVWNDFCDWYIEAAKARLYGDDAEARRSVSQTLLWALERILALVHPACPFVTEAIWGYLPGGRGLLLENPFPDFGADHADLDAEREMQAVLEAVSALRRLRADLELGPAEPLPVAAGDDFPQPALLVRLARAELANGDGAGDGGGIPITAGDHHLVVLGRDLAVRYRARLVELRDRAAAERDRARGKLANDGFTRRAPAAVVDAEREKERRFAREAAAIEARLAELA
jgi:valyl-tRNA synthetase